MSFPPLLNARLQFLTDRCVLQRGKVSSGGWSQSSAEVTDAFDSQQRDFTRAGVLEHNTHQSPFLLFLISRMK